MKIFCFSNSLHNNIPSFFVMIVLEHPHLERFAESILILPCETSFAIRVPVFCIFDAIWVVLLPGEEHKSRIVSFGFGLRARTGSIDAIS